jgi:hypothetical protein
MNEIRLLARLCATELGPEAVAGFIGEQDGPASIFNTYVRTSPAASPLDGTKSFG